MLNEHAQFPEIRCGK